MSTENKPGNANAGEAGQQGHDRQPVDNSGRTIARGGPDEKEAASPGQVHARSGEASAMKQPKHSRPDMVHPGPDREEAEKSKGDLHHDQHELEKEMKPEDL